MLETFDWKKEKIGDYRALSAIVAKHEEGLKNDPSILSLKKNRNEIDAEIEWLSRGSKLTIAEAKEEQQMIKMELLDHWDTDKKTFKCDMGSATLRTNKTLQIGNQNALLIWLFKLERLESAIRTLDTAYLRKLKDADMLPDVLAYYDVNTSVAITEAKE